jgi:hypothetical protein
VTPGRWIHRIAVTLWSAAACERFLEPAIADLQHDCAGATTPTQHARALAHGYVAVWVGLAACAIHDRSGSESHAFTARARTAFLLTVAIAFVLEFVLMHTTFATRHYIVTRVPYVGFAAMTDTATLRFGLPLAMFPAIFYAASRAAAPPRAAAVRTIALGALATFIASGFVAPSLDRMRAIRDRDAFVAATGRHDMQPPLDWQLDRYAGAKLWPALIRGALAPPPHRFAGYPAYVAPEDQDLQRSHRQEIYERTFVVMLAIALGVFGWTAARLRHMSA